MSQFSFAFPKPGTKKLLLGASLGALIGITGLLASLLVFVSFAMPEATITRLLDQASRARATLVLRGFVNGSLRDTVERMQRLIGNRQVAVQIDPQAFDRFSIVRTPRRLSPVGRSEATSPQSYSPGARRTRK